MQYFACFSLIVIPLDPLKWVWERMRNNTSITGGLSGSEQYSCEWLRYTRFCTTTSLKFCQTLSE